MWPSMMPTSMNCCEATGVVNREVRLHPRLSPSHLERSHRQKVGWAGKVLLAVTRDITAQTKPNPAASKGSDERYRVAFHLQPDAVTITGCRRPFLDVNGASRAFSAGEVVGRTPGDIDIWFDRDRNFPSRRSSIRAGLIN